MSDVKGGSLRQTVFSRCLTSICFFFVATTFVACAWDEFEGPQGPAGQNGEDGAQGEPGATGPQGPAGQNGEDGAQGEPGATGPQGPAGQNGEDGADGADYPDCHLAGNACESGYLCDSRGRCVPPLPDEGSGEEGSGETDLCPESDELEEPVTYYGDIDRDGRGEPDVEIAVCETEAPAGYTASATGDNCPLTPNADQVDTDADGLGDACDTVVTPPPTTSTITVQVLCSALCQAHIYYGVEDQMGLSPFTFEVPRDQACESGIEVKGRVPSGNWSWYGDAGAPTMSTVSVYIEGVRRSGVLRVRPWTNSEGNLYFSPALLGCP